MSPPTTIKLVVCYAPEDDGLFTELDVHLSSLRSQENICIWSERQIAAGEDRDAKIRTQIDSAQILLLLVSADFLACGAGASAQMALALERHSDGDARVIPVILRPCDWRSMPIGQLRVLPSDGQPVTTWPSRDLAWVNVVTGIREVIALHQSAVGASDDAATDGANPVNLLHSDAGRPDLQSAARSSRAPREKRLFSSGGNVLLLLTIIGALTTAILLALGSARIGADGTEKQGDQLSFSQPDLCALVRKLYARLPVAGPSGYDANEWQKFAANEAILDEFLAAAKPIAILFHLGQPGGQDDGSARYLSKLREYSVELMSASTIILVGKSNESSVEGNVEMAATRANFVIRRIREIPGIKAQIVAYPVGKSHLYTLDRFRQELYERAIVPDEAMDAALRNAFLLEENSNNHEKLGALDMVNRLVLVVPITCSIAP